MLIPAVGTTASTAATGATGTPSADDQLGKDTFLKLMVAQLRYQDPLNPTDSADFLAQSAQFTSLEKLETVASQSAQAFAAQLAFGASSLVGRPVTYTAADGTEASGSVASVRFTATGPLLDVDGTQVSLDSIVSVGS